MGLRNTRSSLMSAWLLDKEREQVSPLLWVFPSTKGTAQQPGTRVTGVMFLSQDQKEAQT